MDPPAVGHHPGSDEAGRPDGVVDSAAARRMAIAVEDWFRQEARDLPWRRRRDGYRSLVAEAMLQQTQVARVIERYERFVDLFPTVQALASADEREVLAAWQGLGYYRRARNLHAAARRIVDQFGGEVPAEVESLRRLEGVGRYTAGAIASIVHDKPEPIVDGNVARVIARLFAREGPPDSAAELRWMWGIAAAMVHEARSPASFNEGLMELGATVCTPAAPRCGACPLHRECAAFRLGRTHDLPRPKRPARRIEEHHHAVVILWDDGRILLRPRPEGGLWAGMWEVPTLESDLRLHGGTVRRRLGFPLRRCRRIAGFIHLTTHRRITFHVFAAEPAGVIDGVRRRPENTADLPLSNAQRRVLSLLGH